MGVRIREKQPGSGVWWVFISSGGHRRSKQVGDKVAAEQVAREIQTRVALGEQFTFDLGSRPLTVREHWEVFRDTYLLAAVRISTRERYVSIFRTHVLPEFGHMRLDAVTHSAVERFVTNLVVEKRLARATVQTVVQSLCRFLNHARKHGLIPENPATDLGFYYRQARVVHERIQPLTVREVPEFLAAVSDVAPQHFGLFLCAVHTGLRASELAGLQWTDLDFEERFVMVRRSLRRGAVHPTKTNRIRRVDMSDSLADCLRKEMHERQAGASATHRVDMAPWVFCNRHGGPLEMNNIRNRYFYKCLDRAGLRRIRFHDLRHTFASLLIQNGEPLAYVKEQLGHSSIKMTVDVYGHLQPGANRAAVNRLPVCLSNSG